jgi:hypothetical protein
MVVEGSQHADARGGAPRKQRAPILEPFGNILNRALRYVVGLSVEWV